MSKNEMKKPILSLKEKRRMKKELNTDKVIKPRKRKN